MTALKESRLRRRALSLISGGLDSILAAKVVQEQNIEVIGINYTSPFWTTENSVGFLKQISEQAGFEIINVPVDNRYYEMVREPDHGHGKNINPCIDCKIYMIRKTGDLLKDMNADFVVTGEVLGQRPMSQMSDKLRLIEKESGLAGYLLRPLSAKLLPETIPEINGWIDRERLLDINGRTRRIQNQLKIKYNITVFNPPAGGCLLTEIHFERKMNDFFLHYRTNDENRIKLLKYGRHFRYNGVKIIVGRNHNENEMILSLRDRDDYIMEVPDIGSPATLIEQNADTTALKFAAGLTALYSDADYDPVTVRYFKSDKLLGTIETIRTDKETADIYNLSL